MTPVHDATDADYIVTAVLLASHMRGNSRVIQEWSDAFNASLPHNSGAERTALAAAFKVCKGEQMDRVVTVIERLLGVELGATTVQTYCIQISAGTYLKWGSKKKQNRVLCGDHEHFRRICHHLAQLGNAELGHLAGKGGRYGKGAEKPAVDLEARLAEVQAELADYKRMLTRETAASTRYHGRVEELKAKLRACAKPDAAADHHAKEMRAAHKRADELQGRLQGAQRELKEKEVECRSWEAKAHTC